MRRRNHIACAVAENIYKTIFVVEPVEEVLQKLETEEIDSDVLIIDGEVGRSDMVKGGPSLPDLDQEEGEGFSESGVLESQF